MGAGGKIVPHVDEAPSERCKDRGIPNLPILQPTTGPVRARCAQLVDGVSSPQSLVFALVAGLEPAPFS